MENISSSNKRIAKNTVLLYFRTLFILVVTLFTSRVVLNTLGVENYGIYNVVGGVIAMFTVISGALSSSISRFITFELGKGVKDRLNVVFCTSVNIQLFMALVILLLGETIGLWFLNTHMNIPETRMVAANWVYQCSLLSFCINLISSPYNASIIAHEHMKAFAYISIVEAVLKLGVCYLLILSPADKLITYAILIVVVSLIVRLVYGIYCGRTFEECKYHFVYDKDTFRKMGGFAGWSFLSNGAYIFNTQGVNILINLFFGVTFNAARGIATQVENAVLQFVNNFSMALNPQIIKNYATGQLEDMYKLVCRGSRISFYLLFLLALPIMFETNSILTLWLKIVPDYSVIFLRLAFIGVLIDRLGGTATTACMATGTIKGYTIVISIVGCLVFPLTYIAFKLGLPAQSTYYAYIIIYIGVNVARLIMLKRLTGFPIALFVKDVLIPLFKVTIVSLILPSLIICLMPENILRMIITIIVTMLASSVVIYFLGLDYNERKTISKIIVNKLHIIR